MTSTVEMKNVVDKIVRFCRDRQTGQNRSFFIELDERIAEIGSREGEESSRVTTEDQYLEALSSLLLLVNGPSRSTLDGVIDELNAVTERRITGVDIRFGPDGDALSFKQLMSEDRAFNADEASTISFVNNEISDVLSRRREGTS